MKTSAHTVIMLCLLVSIATSQYYFPMVGKTADDFSSAFGPRNVGSQNYPDAGYDYDFHAAIDIAAINGTNVYPVYDGVVYAIQSSGAPDTYIDVLHEDFDGFFLVRYLHITPSTNLQVLDDVVGGTTTLGTVLDYGPSGSSGDHLDIRYYPDGNTPYGTHANADNPGLLIGSYIPYPEFVDLQGNVIQWNNPGTLGTYVDNGTLHSNPSGRKYFTFGVRVEDDELDLDDVKVYLLGTDGTYYYYEGSLLYNQNNSSSIEYMYPERVRYWDDTYYSFYQTYRIAVGDRISSNDDVGHNSTSIGLYPRMFSSSGDYHTVYFRWYVNDALWSQMSTVTAEVHAADWYGNPQSIVSIPIITCVGCPSPPGSPASPTLSIGTYSSADSSMYLEWNTSQYTDFYRIYRCPSSRAINDNDVIGITALTNYHDSDPLLVVGTSYRYAVAAVNEVGESLNSNEKTATFGQTDLAVSISGPTHVYHPGKWDPPNTYTWNMTTSGGAPPYTQVWKRTYSSGEWFQVGTGTSYSQTFYFDGFNGGTSTYSLKAEATDKISNFKSATRLITEHHSGGVIDPRRPDFGEPALVIPSEFALEQNYPNPFNPETEIRFGLPEDSHVQVVVFDVLGRQISRLADSLLPAGFHSVRWKGHANNGRKVDSGIYFCSLTATRSNGEQLRRVVKMLLTK